ncbi:MAG: hypothetical protein EBR02_04385 [Alphaproteobacteria bacterium]|nr:hypothetical protein [Alphaproteobacteria bacterium]
MPHFSFQKIEKIKLRWCALALLILALMMHFLALPKITEQSIHPLPMGASESIIQPDSTEHTDLGKGFVYTFKMRYWPLQQSLYALHPRGCIKNITINGVNRTQKLGTTCNFNNGILVDFDSSFDFGENIVTIETTAIGITLGPIIFMPGQRHISDVLGFLMIATLCVFLLVLMRRLTGEMVSGVFMCAASIMFFHRLSLTSFAHFTSDILSHLHYIHFIATEYKWPDPRWSMEFYHPPIYYSLQALFLHAGHWLGSFDALSIIRTFSVTCMLTFIAFSILALRHIISHPAAYYTALALLCFFPSSFFLAPKINSELPFYALHGACTYFLICWITQKQIKYLTFALMMFGLGIGARSNMLIIAPLLAATFLYQWRKGEITLFGFIKSPYLWLAVPFLLFGIGLNYGRIFYHQHFDGANTSMLVNPPWRALEWFYVRNTLETLFVFDIANYLQNPFFYSLRSGREYFINALFNTAMFGEGIFDFRRALDLSNAFLLIILYLFNSLVVCAVSLHKNWRFWAMILGFLVPFFALMCMRIIYPFSFHQHFRFIYPCLFAFAGLVGLLIQCHFTEKRGIWGWVGVALSAYFALKSTLLFID